MQNVKVVELLKNVYSAFNETMLAQLLTYTRLLKLLKGTKLLSEGKPLDYFYFIGKGAVKSYYLKDGKEICLWFALENKIIANMRAYKGVVAGY